MREELHELLDRMDVPEQRKDDLRWLVRNLAVRNGKHPDFPEAQQLIRQLLRKRA